MAFLKDLIRLLRKIIVNTVISSKLFPRVLRSPALRLIGFSCGDMVLYSNLFIDGRYVTNVSFGDGVRINNQVYIDASEKVTIKENAGIASRCMILTATHEIGASERRWGPIVPEPVTIGRGAWLAAGVTVMPGVTIGDGCVIGSGSLVTKDCEPNAIYVGRPAKLVRRLDEQGNDLPLTARTMDGS